MFNTRGYSKYQKEGKIVILSKPVANEEDKQKQQIGKRSL
jgi:hypothetical protein